MRWNYASWLLVTVLAVYSAISQAVDITITVKGKVVAKPCTVATSNATVDFGDLFLFDMISPGSSSVWHPVTFKLTNCPIGTSRIMATFSGIADSTGYYKNQGTANNIQLELQDESGTRLNNGVKKTVQVDDSTLSSDFPLKVRVLTVKGNPTQGTIQAVITLTYSYL